MPGRVHDTLRGTNAGASYGWLLTSGGSTSGSEGSAHLAKAKALQNRKRRKRLALMERREPARPIDDAVAGIVQSARSGRTSKEDLEATQQRELDRLHALRVMHGMNPDIERLAAATEVRGRALDQVKRDPFINVMAPPSSTVREANDCHNPPGSPEGGQFCSKGDFLKVQTGENPATGKPIHSYLHVTKTEGERVYAQDLTNFSGINSEGWLQPSMLAKAAKVTTKLDRQKAEGLLQAQGKRRAWTPEHVMTAGSQHSWRDEPDYAGPRSPFKRVQVRPKVRGDVSGFSVIGPRINIFVRKRETAKAIQSALKRGAPRREVDDLILGERTNK